MNLSRWESNDVILLVGRFVQLLLGDEDSSDMSRLGGTRMKDVTRLGGTRMKDVTRLGGHQDEREGRDQVVGHQDEREEDVWPHVDEQGDQEGWQHQEEHQHLHQGGRQHQVDW